MVTITLLKFDEELNPSGIVERLDKKRKNGFWIKAKKSRYDEKEVEIDVWYEESIEIGLKRAFSDEAYEMLEYLKNNGKEKILRKVYCFINCESKTVEIYRGIDAVTYKIKEVLEELLETNLSMISLDAGHLIHIVAKYSSELKQAMFKYIHGLWYHILRGRHLENNFKFKDFIVTKPESLRVVSVIPKINYLNGSEYAVTINGDKGTIKMYDGFYKWKPRVEVRQIVSIIANVAGLPSF